MISIPNITPDMMTLETALALGAAGFYVFPVDHPDLDFCAGIGGGP